MPDVIVPEFTTVRRNELTRQQVDYLREKYGREPKLGIDYQSGTPHSYHFVEIHWRKDDFGHTVSYEVSRHLFVAWDDGGMLRVPLGRLRKSDVDRHFPNDSYYLGLFRE